MEIKNKYVMEKLHFSVDGIYNYIVKTLTSVDNGKTFYYCGISKYFQTKQKAENYIKSQF